MIKINMICPFFGTSGYVQHSRGLANALFKVCDVKLSTGLIQGWETQVNDNELKMIMKADDNERTNVIIDLPYNWPMHCQKKDNIGFLVWEGDKIPLSFIDNILDERITQVWVPSNHTKEAILNTVKELLAGEVNSLGAIILNKYMLFQPTMGIIETRAIDRVIKDKIKIVPHGVDQIFQPMETIKDKFTFFMNKGFRNELDRGGIQYGIKAFLQEFKKDEAKLVIKLNLAYAISPELIHQIIMKYWQETKRTDEPPEIQIIYDNLTQKQLCELYNKSDVYLGPTRCEAFGLPFIESMACRVPCIATDFGGQTDFINEENGWLIPYELEEIKHEIMYEGVSWATPNIEKLRNVMREAFLNENQRLEKGIKSLETAKNYSWDNSAKIALSYLWEPKHG